MKFHYVYTLRSTVDMNRFYVGLTQNLEQRLIQHNQGNTLSTKSHAPWRIETATAFSDSKKAVAFEKYLKSHSGRVFAKRHF